MGKTLERDVKPPVEEIPLEIPELEKLPPDVKKAAELLQKPEFYPLWRPDLTIKAKANSCHSVTFTATYRPGLFPILPPPPPPPPFPPTIPVEVRVYDVVGKIKKTVANFYLDLPARGGSVTATVDFPMPLDAHFEPDWFNEITVVIDPDNHIFERNETNNTVKVTGTCIG